MKNSEVLLRSLSDVKTMFKNGQKPTGVAALKSRVARAAHRNDRRTFRQMAHGIVRGEVDVEQLEDFGD